jgi:hypothetical protein
MQCAGSQLHHVLTAVERVRRACHGFHGKPEPIGCRRLLVGGVDLEPAALPVPGHSDAGPARVADEYAGLPVAVECNVGKRVVDLDGTEGAPGTEVELVACH